MSQRERQLRSRLSQLTSQAGLLRGSLSVRRRVCGKPGCKCARGDKHVSLYLVVAEQGERRQIFIPKDLEGQVRRWVENYRLARRLLGEASRGCLKRVERRERL